MTKKKWYSILISLSLSLVLFVMPCLTRFTNHTEQIRTTTIEISKQEIDYQSLLDEFDDGELETQGSLTTFEGYKSINLADLEGIDLTSESTLSEDKEVSIKYNFSYDAETGIVTLSAQSINFDGTIEIDEIQGVAFYNEKGEIDALLDVEGESVFLSEMQDAGLIANCGWFSKLFKKIVVAVVVVVAVSAVAAAVVATCGAGLGACIAAGAVAGGITGGVSGGIISYQETGKIQVWAVVGGLIGGVLLGGLTGWAVGTIMGAGTKLTYGFAKGSFESSEKCLQYHFQKHGAEVGAKTVNEYVKLAAETAQKVVENNIPAIRAVSGATSNVFRYEVGNFYIHMAKNAKEIIIVSFGLL